MINNIFCILIVATAVFQTSCAADTILKKGHSPEGAEALSNCNGRKLNNRAPNTTKPGLISEDHHYYGEGCFKKIIESTFATGKPIVLFVHGRGKHPSKTIKNDLLSSIRNQYNVSILTYTWPSYTGRSGFPDEKARNSRTGLENVLKSLYRIKKTGGYNQPISLLTHSMGSIVLQGLMEKSTGSLLPKHSFESVVISASASSHKDHKKWVEKLTFFKKAYIVSNSNDKALLCLEGKKLLCKLGLRFNLSARLGRIGGSVPEENASNATYIDFTKSTGKSHRYYINHAKKSPRVFNFYRAALAGKIAE